MRQPCDRSGTPAWKRELQRPPGLRLAICSFFELKLPAGSPYMEVEGAITQL